MDEDDELTEAVVARDAPNVRGIDWVFNDPDEAEYEDEFSDGEGDVDPAARKRAEELVKGLLWRASISLVDLMFDDLATLTASPKSDDVYVLSMLPRRFMQDYDTGFARMFLVAIVDVTTRVADTWTALPTVAHELALRLLLNEADRIRQDAGIELPGDWRSELEQVLFEDLDHEFLYDGRGIEQIIGGIAGMMPMDIGSWFAPFSPDSRPAPYATGITPDDGLPDVFDS